ncbi:MAG: ABC transporter ATP-binding protein [Gemmataceae bacterium]|nr:ABC transporter ATP-binding protein [Gemmataceae bacterium]
MTAAAEFVNVAKTYRVGLFGRGRRPAVDGVSLAIQPGEVFGLLGPNRAGKTTLVKLLLSLVFPTGGQVLRLGKPVDDRSTLARVGYVHENHAFPRYLNPVQLLEYYAALALVPHEVVRRRVPELLEKVGLADRAGDPIRTFSKGMTQRLGLAQALMNEPDLLVLDEPSEGLDLSGRNLIADVVATCRTRGAAVILVSHVLREVEPLVDRVGVIVGGRLVALAPPRELVAGKSLEDALAELYTRPTS